MPRRLLAIVALVAAALLVTGCGLLPVPTPGPATAPGGVTAADLAAHRQAWTWRGITSYTWTVSFGCECMIDGPVEVTVAGGVATSATMAGAPIPVAQLSGFPLTVDALHAKAQAALDGGGTVTAIWGSGGLPATMLIDPIRNAVDDELSVTVTSFAPAA